MSNRERAAYIIENYGLNCETCNEKKDICELCGTRARIAVDELINAGLLVTDTDRPAIPSTVILSAADDYAAAPVGTIVAGKSSSAYAKTGENLWKSTYKSEYSDAVMADLSREVLRWGPGGEA